MSFARLALPVALVIAAPAFAQDTGAWSSSPAVGLGPLALRSRSPLNVLRLTPTPMVPETLAAGQWQVGTIMDWDNYFDVEPGRYTIDAESFAVTIALAYGITDRIEADIATPVAYRGGGILDHFIERFESAVGVPNWQRRAAPRDRFLVSFTGPGGQVEERSGAASGWGIEDTDLCLRYQVARGTETTPAVVVGLGLKLPTGREKALRSTGGTDSAAGVNVGQRLGRFHLYTTIAIMHYSPSDFAGVQLTHTQWSWFAGAEYRATERTSLLVQGLRTSPVAKHFGDLSKPTYEVTLGLKHLVSEHVLLEASLLENLFIFDNSPDFGVHVGLVWRSPTPAAGSRAQ